MTHFATLLRPITVAAWMGPLIVATPSLAFTWQVSPPPLALLAWRSAIASTALFDGAFLSRTVSKKCG
jgi:hypothetical protein